MLQEIQLIGMHWETFENKRKKRMKKKVIICTKTKTLL